MLNVRPPSRQRLDIRASYRSASRAHTAPQSERKLWVRPIVQDNWRPECREAALRFQQLPMLQGDNPSRQFLGGRVDASGCVQEWRHPGIDFRGRVHRDLSIDEPPTAARLRFAPQNISGVAEAAQRHLRIAKLSLCDDIREGFAGDSGNGQPQHQIVRLVVAILLAGCKLHRQGLHLGPCRSIIAVANQLPAVDIENTW